MYIHYKNINNNLLNRYVRTLVILSYYQSHVHVLVCMSLIVDHASHVLYYLMSKITPNESEDKIMFEISVPRS